MLEDRTWHIDVDEDVQPRSHSFKPLITSNDVAQDVDAGTLLVACVSPEIC